MPEPISIQQISIKSFKAFTSLQAGNFSRINLITGKNNCGKSCLLEALFLCLGPANPELWVNITVKRSELNAFYPAMVDQLFNKFITNQDICFEVNESSKQPYKLKISKTTQIPYQISSIKQQEKGKVQTSKVIDVSNSISLKFVYIPYKKPSKELITHATISPNEIIFTGQRQTIFVPSAILWARGGRNPDVANYSSLDKENRIPEFEKALRIIEPDLKRTSIIIENNTAFVAGDTGYGLAPLSIIGEGMNSFASILLTIGKGKDGVCLIDEIENGLHYSIFENFWSLIDEYSQMSNCQIFATTHSYDCIKAANNVFKQNKSGDFSLHRLIKNQEETTLHFISQEQLESALITDLDIR